MQPLSHTSSPMWPQISMILAKFPEWTLSQSFSVCPSWTLAVFLPQAALCPFLKTTLIPLGCLEPPLEPPSRTSLPQLPQSQGHAAGAKPLWFAVL